jgi:hypothetical protein
MELYEDFYGCKRLAVPCFSRSSWTHYLIEFGHEFQVCSIFSGKNNRGTYLENHMQGGILGPLQHILRSRIAINTIKNKLPFWYHKTPISCFMLMLHVQLFYPDTIKCDDPFVSTQSKLQIYMI